MSGREMIVLIVAIAAISVVIVVTNGRKGDSIEPFHELQRRNALEAQEEPSKVGSILQLFGIRQ
jgi:hypothetical protein